MVKTWRTERAFIGLTSQLRDATFMHNLQSTCTGLNVSISSYNLRPAITCAHTYLY